MENPMKAKPQLTPITFTPSAAEVADKVQEFVALVQKMYDENYQNPNLPGPTVSAKSGGRYYKVILTEQPDARFPNEKPRASVYCFIEKSNGDLLKAASWRIAAKGKRGSIFKPNCDVGTVATVYGGGFYRIQT